MLSRDQWNEVAQCAAAAKRLHKLKASRFDIIRQGDAEQMSKICDNALTDWHGRVMDVVASDEEAVLDHRHR